MSNSSKNIFVSFIFLFLVTHVSALTPFEAHVLSEYNYIDPEKVVPEAPLKKMIMYYDQYKANLKNINFITIFDVTQRSNNKRMFVIDMKTGRVWSLLSAHGNGSDKNHDGVAEKFSNVSGSNATSLGLYLTKNEYMSSNNKIRRALRLQGLQASNSNAYSRAIVIHGADYVSQDWVNNYGKIGRSNGCPAVDRKDIDRLIDLIKEGSLLYVWHQSLENKTQRLL